jgi:hypothetical protein
VKWGALAEAAGVLSRMLQKRAGGLARGNADHTAEHRATAIVCPRVELDRLTGLPNRES